MDTPTTPTNDSRVPHATYTTDKVARAAHDTIDDTAEKARSFEASLRGGAKNANQALNEQQDAAIAKMREVTGKAEAFAREQPLTAAGIAFAAGIVAAALLRR